MQERITKKRGPKEKYQVEELKKIAVKIKTDIGDKNLTYLLLQEKTGINRQVWSRKLKNFINELNEPIRRAIIPKHLDGINFPNIEDLVNFNSKGAIIDKLSKFEDLLKDYYKSNVNLTNDNKILKEEMEHYKEMLRKEKKLSNIYKEMYENIVVSSVDPVLRKEKGLIEDLLTIEPEDMKFKTMENSGLQKVKKKFPNLF